MRDNRAICIGLGIAFGCASATFAAEPGIKISHAVAQVQVIPEDRTDVAVNIQPGNSRLPTPTVHHDGATIVVDGGLAGRAIGCGTYGLDLLHWRNKDSQRAPQRVKVSGIGEIALDHAPRIIVRMPRSANISADGAVYGDVGPTRSLALDVNGCGDWRLGDVGSDLALHLNGSGDLRGGAAGAAAIAVIGSGDVTLVRVTGTLKAVLGGSGEVQAGSVGGADLALQGSGDIHIHQIAGPLSAALSGSGDVKIDTGSAPKVQVALNGSGDFSFGGAAGAVSASDNGSGSIQITAASGPIAKVRNGSGDIHIGPH